MLGNGYVVDHCIAVFNHRQELRNAAYYITDTLYILVRATTSAQIPRYYDIANPQPEDTRSGQEIAEDIIRRHGLKVVDE